MKSLALITKILAVAFVAYLIPQTADLWESRNNSSLVNEVQLASATPELEFLSFPRKNLSGQEVGSIASKNLFRKQRSQYVKPKVRRVKKKGVFRKAPPVVKAPKVVVPPPKLTLEGVVMIPGRSIAILEGEYASPNAVKGRAEFIPLKSNRFVLGDLIGEYRITEIARDQVTLANFDGETLQVILEAN